MADFIFIRHAESNNNKLAALQYPRKEDRPAFLKVRSPNPELTEDGRRQTELVAHRVVEEYYGNENSTSRHNGSQQHSRFHYTSPEGPPTTDAIPQQYTPLGPPTSSFTPRPIAEIWCSYLTRAIETAVAVQDAIREGISADASADADDNDNNSTKKSTNSTTKSITIPPIRLTADATEVGGHYQYDATTDTQKGSPGFNNKDVRERWPNAVFVFDNVEMAMKEKKEEKNGNKTDDASIAATVDAEGWYKGSTKETHEEALVRAGRLISKMEGVAVDAAAAAAAPHSNGSVTTSASTAIDARRPVIVVITHGDFFRTLLQNLTNTTPVAAVVLTSPNTIEGEGEDGPTSPTSSININNNPHILVSIESPSGGDGGESAANNNATTDNGAASSSTMLGNTNRNDVVVAASPTLVKRAKGGGANATEDSAYDDTISTAIRACDKAIVDRAAVRQNIGNTSLNHFGINVYHHSTTTVNGTPSSPAYFYNWYSAFIADNGHVHKDPSQKEAIARFEAKGKDDFEDTATK